MNKTKKPLIVIPMGDPNGIGPEIVIKALCDETLHEYARPLVVGNADILENVNQSLRLKAKIISIEHTKDIESAEFSARTIHVLHTIAGGEENLKVGTVQGEAGKAAYAYIKRACLLAMDGCADAVATTPINKESLHAGGIDFIGHTEIFAALTDTKDPLTMFEVQNLRVFFLSRHVSLAKSIEICKKDRIVDYIKRCTQALKRLGITNGTMAVAGLNPHCGEHGLFGDNEVTDIEPAVLQAQAEGYQVAGPVGADSVFAQALNGKYNSVLSLYHDQGHIAAKTLDFERTISLTIGMPILRTSVDHGTALDIAGKGIAGCVSMVEAIRLAAKYAPFYRANLSTEIFIEHGVGL